MNGVTYFVRLFLSMENLDQAKAEFNCRTCSPGGYEVFVMNDQLFVLNVRQFIGYATMGSIPASSNGLGIKQEQGSGANCTDEFACLIEITSARPNTKPVSTDSEKNWAIRPSLSRPHRTATTPANIANGRRSIWVSSNS